MSNRLAGFLFFGAIGFLVMTGILTIPWMQEYTGNTAIRAVSICKNITAPREEDRGCSNFEATGELLEETNYKNLIGKEWNSYSVIRGKR